MQNLQKKCREFWMKTQQCSYNQISFMSEFYWAEYGFLDNFIFTIIIIKQDQF